MDPKKRLMGVGVQSHYFSVGSVVPWVSSGQGAVATQAMVEVSYGPQGLELMGRGLSASEALQCLLDEDSLSDTRQISFLDIEGNIETHTGSSCIPEAGHHVGTGFSCQANMMLKDTVWQAMASAFNKNKMSSLEERMLQAMKAAEAEGGDIRGRQSASLIISKMDRSQSPWQDILMDIRVEDHPEPLAELERLLNIKKAYMLADAGEVLMGEGQLKEAFEYYSKANKLCPNNTEIKFWHAFTMAKTGQREEALEVFRSIFSKEMVWKELLERLMVCGMIDEELASYFLEKT